MSNKNLTIDLDARTDAFGKTYYIGKLEAPITIDCKDGAVFLIYVSDVGGEELQIGPLKDSSKKKARE